MPELLSPNGCLTHEGVATVRAAPPGGVPQELATHVASCARCQDRLLAVERSRPADAPKVEPPSIQRTMVFLGLILAAALIGLATMYLMMR
jgi:hypothetical protein